MESGEVDRVSEDEGDFLENDPFSVHFETTLQEEDIAELQANCQTKHETRWPCLGNLICSKPLGRRKGGIQPSLSNPEIDFAFLKDVLKTNLETALKVYRKPEKGREKFHYLSPLQTELLSVMCRYRDLYYPERTFRNGDDIGLCYCLHALNHVLKARSRVLHHNAKLKRRAIPGSEEYRDRGLTRPKVLIVLPFKNAALKVVKFLSSLMFGSTKENVANKKRFQEEYGTGSHDPSRSTSRPEDFEATFRGNVDDAFRIGLAVAGKSLKLYAEFYSADIVVASPLGLRTIVGSEGDKQRDYDFLSSVEMLILDQADVFLMQNWDHVLHLVQHLHLQPRESHGVDFSRVRTWALDGLSKYYRQTLIFSGVATPLVVALWNKHCQNYGGSILIRNPITLGSISQVFVQLPQVFRQFEVTRPSGVPEARFNFFVKEIIPRHGDSTTSHTLVFVPSYFDFVRVRNHFKKEDYSFVQICEYTEKGRVAQARDLFFHGKSRFLLYTERFHFFWRYRIKGIRHVVFYALPTYPHFYSEICNLLHAGMRKRTDGAADVDCTVLYCRYDVLQLEAVVGTDRATNMINSEKRVHLFMT